MKLTTPALAWACALIAAAGSTHAQELVWTKTIGTTVSDEAVAAASDGTQGMFVGGTTRGGLAGPAAGGIDAWLARYDRNGSQVWSLQLGTSADDSIAAAASDGSGGVFVAGFTGGDLGGPSNGGNDAWLARYDAAGNQLWIRQFGTAQGDRAAGLAPAPGGGVYLVGFSSGGFAGGVAGSWRMFIARYSPDGSPVWERPIETLEEVNSGLASVAATQGGMYVGASMYGRAITARCDDTGQVQWLREYAAIGLFASTWSWGVVDDGAGGVFNGGYWFQHIESGAGWLARYDAQGNEVFARQDEVWMIALAPAIGGGLFAAHSSVFRLDSSGNVMTRTSVYPAVLRALLTDASGLAFGVGLRGMGADRMRSSPDSGPALPTATGAALLPY